MKFQSIAFNMELLRFLYSLIFSGLLLLQLKETDSGEVPVGGTVIGTINGKTFFIHPRESTDFLDADAWCFRDGGNDIARIEDSTEVNLITEYFSNAGTNSDRYWIGATNFGWGHESNGGYIWALTQQPVITSNWYPRQSFSSWRRCAAVEYTQFSSYALYWFHEDCRQPFKFVCQVAENTLPN